MDDDIEFYFEVQAYRIPRIAGIDNCRVGAWRVFEVPCRWLQSGDRRNKQRKIGNDK